MSVRERMIVIALFVVAMLLTIGWFFAMFMATPVQARCYSVWHYPWAQRCSDRVAQRDPPAPPVKPDDQALPAFTVSKYDTIILSPVPGRTDEEGRADAIRILKEVMGK